MTGAGTSFTGVTSWGYHISMWILVTAGILANLVVIVWRCQCSRLTLLSVPIISLAVADLCFCCHFLLQEVMLTGPVFTNRYRNQTFNVTITAADNRLCLATTFFAYVSTNAILLMSVAIAAYTYLSLQLLNCGKKLMASFLLAAWTTCLVFGAAAVWNVSEYYSLTNSRVGVEELSIIVIYGCIMFDWSHFMYFPLILTTVNAVSSLVIAIIYISLWRMIRRSIFNSFYVQAGSQEIYKLCIRLVVVSGVNLLCWWPLCVLSWIAVTRKPSVYYGTLSSSVTEMVFIINAAGSVLNPFIYTIASKGFHTAFRRACARCFLCRSLREEQTSSRSRALQINEQTNSGCFVCCRLHGRRSQVDVWRSESEYLSDVTCETDLMTAASQ